MAEYSHQAGCGFAELVHLLGGFLVLILAAFGGLFGLFAGLFQFFLRLLGFLGLLLEARQINAQFQNQAVNNVHSVFLSIIKAA